MSIELKNVSKRFGNVAAVNNVSFSANEGELLALLGPSGGGPGPTGQVGRQGEFVTTGGAAGVRLHAARPRFGCVQLQNNEGC